MMGAAVLFMDAFAAVYDCSCRCSWQTQLRLWMHVLCTVTVRC